MENLFQNALIWDKDDTVIGRCPATTDHMALALWLVPGAEYTTTFKGSHYDIFNKESLKEKIHEYEKLSSHAECERITEMSGEISLYEDYKLQISSK